MGIESDQLVFDYLSRVGDLAQQRQLPSSTRMRLVSALRSEIEQKRSSDGGDSPAAVRRILGGLGTPDEVVDGVVHAGSGEAGAVVRELRKPAAPKRAVPEQRRRGRRVVPQPRKTAEPPPAPMGPHLAGMDEVGSSGGEEPDWWRLDADGPDVPMVPGFVGGVEIPDILKPPPVDGDDAEGEAGAGDGVEAEEEDEPAEGARRGRRRLRLRRKELAAAPEEVVEAATPPGRVALAHPFLLLAALLLIGGAAFGNLLALAAGWALAYISRRISRAEAKWVVLGLPGLVAAGGAVWLWGRFDGRWGTPIAPGGEALSEALSTTWPWLLRTAALASALYLLWRSRRP